MQRSYGNFMSFLLGFLTGLSITLIILIRVFGFNIPIPPIIPPDLSPKLYFTDAKIVDIAGVIRCEDKNLKSEDIKVIVKTAQGYQKQVKVFETNIVDGIFIFFYSVPIGRISENEIDLPIWFNKKVKQQIKIIKFPEKRFQQWRFPHIIQCQVPVGYQALPSIRKVEKPSLMVDFIIKKLKN